MRNRDGGYCIVYDVHMRIFNRLPYLIRNGNDMRHPIKNPSFPRIVFRRHVRQVQHSVEKAEYPCRLTKMGMHDIWLEGFELLSQLP